MNRNIIFDLKDTVYLKTDPEQSPRLITGIMIREHGVIYQLSCGEFVSNHYGFEISTNKEFY